MGRKTVVVNLLGGGGIGKSTTAAHLFAEMKLRHLKVELVSEYVKKWAWYGRKPGPFDQLYITGKQTHSEALLYGKVDFIVTDSPIVLGGFYDWKYNGMEVVMPSLIKFLELAAAHGVEHRNFFLSRHKEFNPEGRYEKTIEEAVAVDDALKDFLVGHGIGFTDVPVVDRERPIFIMERLGLLNA